MSTLLKVAFATLFTLTACNNVVCAVTADRQVRLTADAKQLVENIGQRKFEQVEARFDAKMIEALPLEKLRSTTDGIVAQAGELKHVGDATVSEHEGYLIILIDCDFAQAPLRAQVVYDSDDKVAGLFFRPHEPAAYVPPETRTESRIELTRAAR